MKKVLASLVFAVLSLSSIAFADPQYTLQTICVKYGKFGQCSSVPFCQEQSFASGCYLAQGAPAYVEGLCKLQTQKQGCDIMAAQGNCVWVDQAVSTCNSKIKSL
jgi:hypothetical protein